MNATPTLGEAWSQGYLRALTEHDITVTEREWLNHRRLNPFDPEEEES